MSIAQSTLQDDRQAREYAYEHLAHIDATVPAHLRPETYRAQLSFLAPLQLPTRANLFDAICDFYDLEEGLYVG